jgi:ribosome-binding protein aMBF1 (putative translation factor)
MDDFDRHLQEMLKDPEFKAEYDALEAEYTMISALIRARNEAGLTQKELSSRTGIDQAILSRIENGNANPSLKTLDRLAKGLGKKLVIEFR